MRPSLTIAIPTFNRASILDKSLFTLLPQIDQFNTDIELIISDNASIDDTQFIISKHAEKFPKINLKSNLQPFNTGYYGNFKKCRELSNGEYFWLLSDNEHINNNVIKYLLDNIIHNPKVAAFYLNNKYSTVEPHFFEFIENNIDVKNIFLQKNAYKLTLISAVIMLNYKNFDNLIFNRYENNSFLGFMFLLNAMRKNKAIAVLEGPFFRSEPSNVTFNVFDVWSKDINDCLDYMIESRIINDVQRNIFVTNLLKNIVKNHIYFYKITGKIHGKSYGSIICIKHKLDKYYANIPYYNKHVIRILKCPKIVLIIHNFFRRAKNKLIRIFN